MEFRVGLSEIYHQVFGNESDGFSEPTEFDRTWNWYATIDELAGGDVTKYEAIEQMNMHRCLNNLCYKIDKRKRDAEELKKINRKYGR